MIRSMVAAVSVIAILAVGAGYALAADAAGSCGKGKVFNPDTQICVAKPKGSGSGSHSG